jgi:hypothetical protein
MARWTWVLAAAVGVLLTSASARAQDAASHKGKLDGKAYLFTVPPGWTATDNAEGVAFAPPPGRLRAGFECWVAAFSGSAGERTAIQFAKDVAKGHKDKTMPWADVTEPDDFTFMGEKGALITVGGTNPASKTPEAAMFLLAPGKGVIYAFVAAGRLDDLQDNAQDLVAIINGVRSDDGKADPRPGNPGGKGGGCVGFGCGGGPPPAISEPPWGLEVSGLSDKWVVRAQKNFYVFTAKGGTQVTVRHLWPDSAEMTAARKAAKKAKLGRHPALVVEGKNKKTWFLEVGKLVTVVDLSASDVASAESQVMGEFVDAFSLVKRDFSHRNDGKKGVRMTVANDVSLELPAGWFFHDVGARGAAFGVKAGSGFALVQVRTAKVAAGVDAFAEDLQAVDLQCKMWKGHPTSDTVEVPGFGKARRLRCAPSRGSNKDLRPWYVLVLEARGLQVFLFGTSSDPKIQPDNRVLELAAHITPPK